MRPLALIIEYLFTSFSTERSRSIHGLPAYSCCILNSMVPAFGANGIACCSLSRKMRDRTLRRSFFMASLSRMLQSNELQQLHQVPVI